jgi:hypothetical protein
MRKIYLVVVAALALGLSGPTPFPCTGGNPCIVSSALR